MELWIARDKNGSLNAFTEHEPERKDDFFDRRYVSFNDEIYELNNRLFPEVTWENSPQRVELKLVCKDDVLITPTGFDDFWNLYDKRVGKQKCIKLWGKLTLSEQAECMKYIPLYKQAQPDKQFRKNPETFLRNKSWNDEIIIGNNKDAERSQRLAEAASIVAKYTGADRHD